MPRAIIIGGGPAGSAAAVLLARGGWRVTLVEQHRFPRDKVCGECLSTLGAEVLGRVGLFDSVRSLGAVRLDRTLLHAPSGRRAAAKLPRPMWGLSRVALDGLLLDAAADAGADVIQPARCESIQPGPTPSVALRDLVSNVVCTVEADVVLLADGKSALLPAGAPRTTGDLGIKTHFANVNGPRDAVELFGLTGCYAGLAPIEGDRWNCALSVPAAQVRRHHGDMARLFAELLQQNVTLRNRLARARQLSRWLASPLPRFPVRTNWPRNVIPLGNAAAAIEPIGGEGMGLAMRSAELVAEALIAGDVCPVRVRLAALWRTRPVACRAGAVVASSPRVARAMAPVLGAAPWVLRPALALMGKTPAPGPLKRSGPAKFELLALPHRS
jgi:2-polyprenyl-6-methoxyphenol hydroxylase-like FAD-dependent oxidoreductase